MPHRPDPDFPEAFPKVRSSWQEEPTGRQNTCVMEVATKEVLLLFLRRACLFQVPSIVATVALVEKAGHPVKPVRLLGPTIPPDMDPLHRARTASLAKILATVSLQRREREASVHRVQNESEGRINGYS